MPSGISNHLVTILMYNQPITQLRFEHSVIII